MDPVFYPEDQQVQDCTFLKSKKTFFLFYFFANAKQVVQGKILEMEKSWRNVHSSENFLAKSMCQLGHNTFFLKKSNSSQPQINFSFAFSDKPPPLDRGRPQHERVLHLRPLQLLLVRSPHPEEHPGSALGHDQAGGDHALPRRQHHGELDHAMELQVKKRKFVGGFFSWIFMFLNLAKRKGKWTYSFHSISFKNVFYLNHCSWYQGFFSRTHFNSFNMQTLFWPTDGMSEGYSFFFQTTRVRLLDRVPSLRRPIHHADIPADHRGEREKTHTLISYKFFILFFPLSFGGSPTAPCRSPSGPSAQPASHW